MKINESFWDEVDNEDIEVEDEIADDNEDNQFNNCIAVRFVLKRDYSKMAKKATDKAIRSVCLDVRKKLKRVIDSIADYSVGYDFVTALYGNYEVPEFHLQIGDDLTIKARGYSSGKGQFSKFWMCVWFDGDFGTPSKLWKLQKYMQFLGRYWYDGSDEILQRCFVQCVLYRHDVGTGMEWLNEDGAEKLRALYVFNLNMGDYKLEPADNDELQKDLTWFYEFYNNQYPEDGMSYYEMLQKLNVTTDNNDSDRFISCLRQEKSGNKIYRVGHFYNGLFSDRCEYKTEDMFRYIFRQDPAQDYTSLCVNDEISTSFIYGKGVVMKWWVNLEDKVESRLYKPGSFETFEKEKNNSGFTVLAINTSGELYLCVVMDKTIFVDGKEYMVFLETSRVSPRDLKNKTIDELKSDSLRKVGNPVRLLSQLYFGDDSVQAAINKILMYCGK